MASKSKSATLKDVRYALEFGGERLLRTYSHDERHKGGGVFHPEQDRCAGAWADRRGHARRSPCASRGGWFVPRPLAAVRVEG